MIHLSSPTESIKQEASCMWLPALPTASLGLGPSVRLSSETTPCLQATWAITCHWLGRRCFPPGSSLLTRPPPVRGPQAAVASAASLPGLNLTAHSARALRPSGFGGRRGTCAPNPGGLLKESNTWDGASSQCWGHHLCSGGGTWRWGDRVTEGDTACHSQGRGAHRRGGGVCGLCPHTAFTVSSSNGL